jgi:hypothetical protein
MEYLPPLEFPSSMQDLPPIQDLSKSSDVPAPLPGATSPGPSYPPEHSSRPPSQAPNQGLLHPPNQPPNQLPIQPSNQPTTELLDLDPDHPLNLGPGSYRHPTLEEVPYHPGTQRIPYNAIFDTSYYLNDMLWTAVEVNRHDPHVDAFNIALNTPQIMQDLRLVPEAQRPRHIEMLQSRLEPARTLFNARLADAQEAYRLARFGGQTLEALRKVVHITKSVKEFEAFLKLLEGFPRSKSPPKSWVYTSRKRRSIESNGTAQSHQVKRGNPPPEPLRALTAVGFFDATVADYCRGGWPIVEVKTAQESCRQEWHRLTLVLKARLQESLNMLTHQEKDKWLPGQPAPIVDTLRSMFGNAIVRQQQPENLDSRYEEVMTDTDHLLKAQVLAEYWYHRNCYLYCNGKDKCMPTCWNTHERQVTQSPNRKLKHTLGGFSDVLNISNSAQPPYNVDPSSVKSFSWDSYLESGVTDFATRSLGSAVLTSAQQGLRAVPLMVVCKSPITKSMSELEDFPCVCGDEYGSESMQVWKLTGLDRTIGGNKNTKMAHNTCYSRMREADWIRTRGPQFITNMCRINNHLTTFQRPGESDKPFSQFCRDVLKKVDLDPEFRKAPQVGQRAAVCSIWRQWDLAPRGPPLWMVLMLGPLSLWDNKPGLAPARLTRAMDECICSTDTSWPKSCQNVKPEEWSDSGYLPLVKLPDSPHPKFMKVATTWDPDPQMVPLPNGTQYDKKDRPIIKSPWVYEGSGWGL